MEAELAFGEGAPQSGDKLASKDAAQHFHGKKERIARVNPAGVVKGEPAGGNHAMDVRMMFKLLIPGVEHAEEADLRAEMFGIPSDFEQRFGAGAEQQIVNDLPAQCGGAAALEGSARCVSLRQISPLSAWREA